MSRKESFRRLWKRKRSNSNETSIKRRLSSRVSCWQNKQTLLGEKQRDFVSFIFTVLFYLPDCFCYLEKRGLAFQKVPAKPLQVSKFRAYTTHLLWRQTRRPVNTPACSVCSATFLKYNNLRAGSWFQIDVIDFRMIQRDAFRASRWNCSMLNTWRKKSCTHLYFVLSISSGWPHIEAVSKSAQDTR